MENQLTAISLFTGAGGMDIGFEAAGVSVVLANELVIDASETYRANHPSTVLINDDINNILPQLKEYEGVDLVFGGPPCQGFSVAGKMDPDDERSKLIFTFLDVVSIVKPRAFVMENVKALGELGKWKAVRDRYLERAREIGYTCHYYILNATEYGVPQKRERVFFVGFRGTEYDEDRLRALIEINKSPALSIRDTLRPLGKAGTNRNPNTCVAKITFAINPVMRKSAYAGMYFNGQGRPIEIDGYSNTLPASMGGNKTPIIDEAYLHSEVSDSFVEDYHRGLVNGTIQPHEGEAPKRLRRITIREAARIQTFPDDYIFCGKSAAIYKQIGNAVPCKLAEAVARGVVSYIQNT